jgi:outer membrane protein TolC
MEKSADSIFSIPTVHCRRTYSVRSLKKAAAALIAFGISIIGCAHYPLGSLNLQGTSPRPEVPWTPPQKAIDEGAVFDRPSSAGEGSENAGIPAEYTNRIGQLTLTEIVNIALRNNKLTRQAWAQARAAAAQYAGKWGAFSPTVSASAGADKQKSVAAGGKISFDSRVYSANATLNLLIFDWGGRVAAIDETREALFAANWSHSAVIQNVVFQVEQTFYGYFASKQLQVGQQASVNEAKANLAAAEERNKAGVSTIADVLQARTALSQALLSLEALDAQIMTTRGALATAMGLPANTGFDADVSLGALPIDFAGNRASPSPRPRGRPSPGPAVRGAYPHCSFAKPAVGVGERKHRKPVF